MNFLPSDGQLHCAQIKCVIDNLDCALSRANLECALSWIEATCHESPTANSKIVISFRWYAMPSFTVRTLLGLAAKRRTIAGQLHHLWFAACRLPDGNAQRICTLRSLGGRLAFVAIFPCAIVFTCISTSASNDSKLVGQTYGGRGMGRSESRRTNRAAANNAASTIKNSRLVTSCPVSESP